jgi:hypothetical protein
MEEGEARTNRYANRTKEVVLDRTHAEEATIQHHTPGPNLESTGQVKERKSKKHLEARYGVGI